MKTLELASLNAHVLFHKETMEVMENFNLPLRLEKFIHNLYSVSRFVSRDWLWRKLSAVNSKIMNFDRCLIQDDQSYRIESTCTLKTLQL